MNVTNNMDFSILSQSSNDAITYSELIVRDVISLVQTNHKPAKVREIEIQLNIDVQTLIECEFDTFIHWLFGLSW